MTGMSIDDLASSEAFGGTRGRREQVTFLPEPEARPQRYTVISVDDHVVEPPDAFTDRFPRKYADAEPRVVPTDDGGVAWLWQDQLLPNVGFNAVAGRPSAEFGFEPTRFDEMRRGAWDVDARVADMDIDGVYASACFPSFLPGFVGQRLTLWPRDEELALTAMRAYNDWHLDAWAGAHPDRFIPNQITYLRDPAVAAEEIHRNAQRGFKAATFSEAPDKLGLPSIHSGHWDPLFRACAETGTVLCLHVGSSGTSPTTSDDAPPEIPAVLFGAYGMYSAVDWLYSKVAVRFPDIKICLSEGGIGWVAGILDRLDHCYKYQLGYLPTWRDVAEPPSEVLRRNFWFCALDDDAGMLVRDRIGVEHILVESDYPHADSSWPDTQAMLTRQLEGQGIGDDDARRITWQNASGLFRHPVPPDLQR
jgi:predicted TIM-barrel fold metal-dependent hydrolase